MPYRKFCWDRLVELFTQNLVLELCLLYLRNKFVFLRDRLHLANTASLGQVFLVVLASRLVYASMYGSKKKTATANRKMLSLWAWKRVSRLNRSLLSKKKSSSVSSFRSSSLEGDWTDDYQLVQHNGCALFYQAIRSHRTAEQCQQPIR